MNKWSLFVMFIFTLQSLLLADEAKVQKIDIQEVERVSDLLMTPTYLVENIPFNIGIRRKKVKTHEVTALYLLFQRSDEDNLYKLMNGRKQFSSSTIGPFIFETYKENEGRNYLIEDGQIDYQRISLDERVKELLFCESFSFVQSGNFEVRIEHNEEVFTFKLIVEEAKKCPWQELTYIKQVVQENKDGETDNVEHMYSSQKLRLKTPRISNENSPYCIYSKKESEYHFDLNSKLPDPEEIHKKFKIYYRNQKIETDFKRGGFNEDHILARFWVNGNIWLGQNRQDMDDEYNELRQLNDAYLLENDINQTISLDWNPVDFGATSKDKIEMQLLYAPYGIKSPEAVFYRELIEMENYLVEIGSDLAVSNRLQLQYPSKRENKQPLLEKKLKQK